MFGESLKIYQYIDEEISIAEEFYKTKFPFDISNNEQIGIFRADIKKKILQTQISAQFESSKGTSNYTLENINKFPKDDLSIINFKKIEPIMCKPVLFDIAFNYISYDLDKSKERNLLLNSHNNHNKKQLNHQILLLETWIIWFLWS